MSATNSEPACKRCFFYENVLASNEPKVTCRELERTKKCEFFVDASALEGKALKAATLMTRLPLRDVATLQALSSAMSRDRAIATVNAIQVGTWITYEAKEGKQRKRVGRVDRGFVLVGTEFQPIRVNAAQIIGIDNSDKTPYPEFIELTPKQRKRLEQIRKQNERQSVQYKGVPFAHGPNGERVYNVVAAMPHFVNQEAWVNEHVRGIKPEAPSVKWKLPKFAVRGDDIPFDFVRKHDIAERPDYLDLRRPYSGTMDFVLWCNTRAEAEDKLKWCLARYFAEWPKEKDRFVIETRRDAFKRCRGVLEGRYPYLYFWFGMTTPQPLDGEPPREPPTEVETPSGRVKLIKGAYILAGKAMTRKAQKNTLTSKYIDFES